MKKMWEKLLRIRIRTANITKDDITLQHSDILAMYCKVISSFAIVCCRRP